MGLGVETCDTLQACGIIWILRPAFDHRLLLCHCYLLAVVSRYQGDIPTQFALCFAHVGSVFLQGTPKMMVFGVPTQEERRAALLFLAQILSWQLSILTVLVSSLAPRIGVGWLDNARRRRPCSIMIVMKTIMTCVKL